MLEKKTFNKFIIHFDIELTETGQV